ncbi:hypothetical protein FQN54_003647 [Arachnomyces sp. PD_36]|nr:hypothetical protein FQN54_003647 [Arachnomyces sp. PD_36]
MQAFGEQLRSSFTLPVLKADSAEMKPLDYVSYSAQLLTKSFTVPKNRRPRFDLILRIIDLNNIPLVCGSSYVKWHLPSSTSAEHGGSTDKVLIQDHRAQWNYEKALTVRLTIDRNQMLQECEIHFEVIQEFASTGRGERVRIGNVKLNLAEYVEKTDDDEGVLRRYLVQDSKINSTLKVGVMMRQIEGDRNFIAPPLKTAMVFSGIAGVLASEQAAHDDLGRVASISSKSREAGDLQDTYRRTLAATWSCRDDELPPDELIETLFAGGTGLEPPAVAAPYTTFRVDDYDERGSLSDTESRRTTQVSPAFDKRPLSSSSTASLNESKSSDTLPVGGGRGSIQQQVYGTNRENSRRGYRHTREISEFDIREDLKSWEISAER